MREALVLLAWLFLASAFWPLLEPLLPELRRDELRPLELRPLELLPPELPELELRLDLLRLAAALRPLELRPLELRPLELFRAVLWPLDSLSDPLPDAFALWLRVLPRV